MCNNNSMMISSVLDSKVACFMSSDGSGGETLFLQLQRFGVYIPILEGDIPQVSSTFLFGLKESTIDRAPQTVCQLKPGRHL
jgi:hypothetical protein